LEGLRENLYLGFGAALLVLLSLLWIGLTWGLQALRRLSQELDEIESGTLESLSEQQDQEQIVGMKLDARHLVRVEGRSQRVFI
ncbi:hypothetical protein SB770_34110, partial [Pseudomonas sp. SIMBA_044]